VCGMPEENTKRLIGNQIFALCTQMFATYTTLVPLHEAYKTTRRIKPDMLGTKYS
jgi:hypothetical protein